MEGVSSCCVLKSSAEDNMLSKFKVFGCNTLFVDTKVHNAVLLSPKKKQPLEYLFFNSAIRNN